jgi:hypothetical protein
MLSHPRAQIRDTQFLAHRHGQSRSARPALRNLVHDMLGARIQQGEHSSVRRTLCPIPRRPLNLIAGDRCSCYHGDLQTKSWTVGKGLRCCSHPRPTECKSKGGAKSFSATKVHRSRGCSNKTDRGISAVQGAIEGCLIWSVNHRTPSEEGQGRRGRYQGQMVVRISGHRKWFKGSYQFYRIARFTYLVYHCTCKAQPIVRQWRGMFGRCSLPPPSIQSSHCYIYGCSRPRDLPSGKYPHAIDISRSVPRAIKIQAPTSSCRRWLVVRPVN